MTTRLPWAQAVVLCAVAAFGEVKVYVGGNATLRNNIIWGNDYAVLPGQGGEGGPNWLVLSGATPTLSNNCSPVALGANAVTDDPILRQSAQVRHPPGPRLRREPGRRNAAAGAVKPRDIAPRGGRPPFGVCPKV